jgi:nicotinamide riboside kinase
MRIGFTGTLSVGKTTLVNELKKLPQFKDYEFSTERSKYLRDSGVPLNISSTLIGQNIFLAERSLELLKENIITDRTIIDVMAFTNLSEKIPYYVGDDYEKLASHLIRDYDYIFYISPEGVEIEDNGVRSIDPEYRKEVDEEIKGLLVKYSSKISKLHMLSGSTYDRIEKIKKTLDI